MLQNPPVKTTPLPKFSPMQGNLILAATIIGGITFEGGKGSLVGALLGVLLLGIMYNAMNIVGVSSYMQTIFLGAVIVAATVISNIGKMKKK